MTVEEQIIDKVRKLDLQRKKQVLAYVQGIAGSREPQKPRKSLRGLWKDLGTHITEDDIAQVRREMWGDFPRPLPE